MAGVAGFDSVLHFLLMNDFSDLIDEWLVSFDRLSRLLTFYFFGSFCLPLSLSTNEFLKHFIYFSILVTIFAGENVRHWF
jgi:hypothetical protein